jgi:hypothetical protein
MSYGISIKSFLLALTVGLLLSVAPIVVTSAIEQNAPDTKLRAGEKKQAPVSAPAVQQPLPISLEQALYLIRSTLLTLNDANRSGNYSVLRDLAAPDFQAKNTAADLAQSFADLRHRNFDLFSVALAAPQLTNRPALDGSGMLRLTGLFPTRPLQINFDLLFQNVGGQWRLIGVAVATPQFSAQPEATKPAPANVSQDGWAPKKK